MMTKSRIGLAAVLSVAGLGLIVLSARSEAIAGDDLAKKVKAIAALIEKGKDADAKKSAQTAAKKIDEMSELMGMYRGEDKGGIGIEPGLKKATLKDAKELANLTRAMAELTRAKGWDEPSGKKTKAAWNGFTDRMEKAAKELAAAKTDAEVTKAAGKVTDSCSACHMVFKNN
jgi:cytochrome c556